MNQILNSPQVSAFLTAAVISLLWYLIGKAGSGLEALGAARKMPALIVLGKRLEALAYDGPKLAGKPGEPEAPRVDWFPGKP